MYSDDGMSVNVKVTELLSVLKKNRATHGSIYETAWAAYERLVVQTMEKNLAEAKARSALVMRITCLTPEDHTEDYDRAIGMLEMSVDDEIELSSYDYDRLVLDRWEWRHSFAANTTAYTVTPAIL